MAGDSSAQNMKNIAQNSTNSLLPLLFVAVLFPLGIKPALTVFITITFSLFLFYFFGRSDRFLAFVLLFAFLIRAFIAVIDDSLSIFPYAWDDFYTAALHIKENIQAGYPVFHGIEKSIHLKSYSAFNALFLIVFGNYEIPIRLLNCMLGALVAERVYKISQFLNINVRAAKLALLLTAFWPSFLIFNSLNMRDTLIIFISVDLVLRFLKHSEKGNFLMFLFMMIELLALIVLRTQNILIYVIVLTSYIIYTRVFRKNIFYIFKPLPLLIVGVSIITLFYVSQYFDGLLRYLNVETQWRATGGSAYLVNQNYQTWLDVLKWAPIRFIYFCFGPFPWQVKNGFLLLAFFESIFFLIFFLMTFRLLFVGTKFNVSPPIVFLLLFAILGLAANSLIDSNYGTAIRHKMNYIILFFTFAAVFMQKYRLKILK